jgi:hypothetical protein
VTTVTGTGDQMAASNVEIVVVQVLTGTIVGAISMLLIGLIQREQSRS